jgi:hypothetical protein
MFKILYTMLVIAINALINVKAYFFIVIYNVKFARFELYIFALT